MNDDDRQWQEQRKEYDKIIEQINKPQSPSREIPYTFTGCLPILVALAMSWIAVLVGIYLVVAGAC